MIVFPIIQMVTFGFFILLLIPVAAMVSLFLWRAWRISKSPFIFGFPKGDETRVEARMSELEQSVFGGWFYWPLKVWGSSIIILPSSVVIEWICVHATNLKSVGLFQ